VAGEVESELKSPRKITATDSATELSASARTQQLSARKAAVKIKEWL